VTALVVLAGATIVNRGSDDVPREAEAFTLERTIDRLVLPHVDQNHPVAVVYRGGTAALSVGNHLTFRLVQEGVAVQLSPSSARAYGSYRAFRPATRPSAIVIASGTDTLPPTPGQVVAREVFDAKFASRVDRLVRALDAQPFALAPDAITRADAEAKGRASFVDSLFERYGRAVRTMLTSQLLLELVRKGYVVSPALTATQAAHLETLLAHRRTILADERLRVSIMTPAEVAAAPPPELTSTMGP
jgi:hypothetical protein